jgi:hypothetical protein
MWRMRTRGGGERGGRARTREEKAAPEPDRSAPDRDTLAHRSGGERLPDPLRGRLERGYGARLDDVRVHRDPFAQEAAARVGARAMTVGANVFVGAGQYAPGTTVGAQLLAHEVAHTIQQRGVAPPAAPMSSPGDPAEREARSAASSVVRGERAHVFERVAPHVMRDVHTEISPGTGRSGWVNKGMDKPWDEKTGVTAVTYAFIHQSKIYPALATRLADEMPRLASPYLSWKASGTLEFSKTLLLRAFQDRFKVAPLTAAMSTLFYLLHPDNALRAVDMGRDATPNIYGTPDWMDAVVDELMLLLKKRVSESFTRLSARYVDVKNQHLLRVEAAMPGADPAVSIDEMFIEHQTDRYSRTGSTSARSSTRRGTGRRSRRRRRSRTSSRSAPTSSSGSSKASSWGCRPSCAR